MYFYGRAYWKKLNNNIVPIYMGLLKKCQLTQFLADDPTLPSRGDCAEQARERKVADQDFKKA